LQVDAHVHLWDPKCVDYPWLGPHLGPLNRAFRAVDLAQNLKELDIRASVVVQAANSVEETEYLLMETAACEWCMAVVGWADLRKPRAVEETLRSAGTRLRGLRHLLDHEPSSWTNHAGVRASLRLLERTSFNFEVPALFPLHLDTVPDIARQFDSLTIVIDHLGSPGPGKESFATWADQLRAAAKHPNVYAKLSGLRTVFDTPSPTPATIRPYVDHALTVFGPSRLMWGSDWPVCLLATEYTTAHWLVAEAVADCSRAERQAIFGATAQRVYGGVLPGSTPANGPKEGSHGGR
jgi:L-fuconolactonase